MAFDYPPHQLEPEFLTLQCFTSTFQGTCKIDKFVSHTRKSDFGLELASDLFPGVYVSKL